MTFKIELDKFLEAEWINVLKNLTSVPIKGRARSKQP